MGTPGVARQRGIYDPPQRAGPVFLRLDIPAAQPLRETLLERAIGVLYLPQTERASHYFVTSLAQQFDAVFHLDETSAVEPLDTPPHWHRPEPALATG